MPGQVRAWEGFGGQAERGDGGDRAIRLRRPPHFTRYAVALVGRPTRFSSAKAGAELGWKQKVGVLEGLRRTLGWYYDRLGRPAPVIKELAPSEFHA
jgi:nucleoside-diphosphate-sugar epimerase